MAALLRLVGPAVVKYFGPGPDDLIDTVFDGTPMPVTAEVYPFFPATQITGQTLSINGTTRDFTSVSGQNPTWLQFNLGGDPGEVSGGINTLTVSVADDAGSTTHFVLRYFRLLNGSGAVTTTTTTSTHPLTTTRKPPPKSATTPRTTMTPTTSTHPPPTTEKAPPKRSTAPKPGARSGRRGTSQKGHTSRR